ncbi:Serine/threonine-protein phosphatase 6 regulatory subunit 3 [Lamellibrachia satsuma]|nr:Serine/threonine-protein phosphatase 6 regulatory subunit 3 [Lamellibrachia satsuma]
MLIILLIDLAMTPSRGHELVCARYNKNVTRKYQSTTKRLDTCNRSTWPRTVIGAHVLDTVMFWKFNLLTTHIDTLLDKEDVTLQELLDEDDVLQECKAQNRRLVDFLARPENIEELVNLVTQEPPDETDEKCRYKYPNTACELLTSDVPGITDKLITEDALLDKIYAFLEAEGPLNFLMASFFSKVMGLLITRKSEVMIEFLRGKDDFVGQLLHHLGTSAIMDLLLRLITCIESPECRTTCITWLNEQQLVQKLVAMIDGSQSEEKHCNASQSLCDIIRLSREQMSLLQEKADADPLLATIESKETVSELLSHMFDSERVDSVIINGLSVIQTLLEFKKTGPEGITEQLTMLDADRLTQGISSTLDALIPRLKDIHRILVDAPKQYYSPMRTTFGLLDPPLGNARLQVAHLVASLLARNSQSVNAELANLGTVQTLWELFVKYSWNSFLHSQVEQCVFMILNNPPTEGEDKAEHPLLQLLINDLKIMDRILEAFEDNEQQQSRPGSHRRGYMGHLIKISSDVTESMEKGNNAEKLKELYQEVPQEKQAAWEEFVSGRLANLLKQNTVELVHSTGLHSSSEDDDPDFRDIAFPSDTAMQNAFSDYQLHQMTSNFIDQFGFNDDEFTEQDENINYSERINSINFDINTSGDSSHAATLFEQACSERMQQFDDADSDEDLWEEKELTFSSNSRQNAVGRKPAHVAGSDGSHGDSDSSDSEEELDSPLHIHQTMPASTSTAMEVDNSDNWANFNDVPMHIDSTPIAMDMTSSPTITSGRGTSDRGDRAENWAQFDNINCDKTTTEEWNNSTSDVDNRLNSTNPEARTNSPVAMDTNESATPRPEGQCAYLSTSAPADLATEVSNAASSVAASNGHMEAAATDSASSETAVTNIVSDITLEVLADSADDAAVDTPEQPTIDVVTTPDTSATEKVTESPKKTEVEVASGDNTASLVPPCVKALPKSTEGGVSVNSSDVSSSSVSQQSDIQSKVAADTQESSVSSSEEVQFSPRTPPPFTMSAPACLVVPTSGDDKNMSSSVMYPADFEDDDDDDELNDNFNFLAAGGLMRSQPKKTEEVEEEEEDDEEGNFDFLSRSGLMKTEVTEDDSHTTESEDTTSKSSEAASTEPSSPSKSDLEEKRAAAQAALEQYTSATTHNGPV